MVYQTAIRPRRSSDDVFFVNGDRLALQSSDALVISYIENEDVPKEKGPNINDTNETNDDTCTGTNHEYNNPTISILHDTCDDFQLPLHEIDYHCSQCHNIYPNDHLLDLHIQEIHDSYFQTKLIRKNEAQYSCLVLNCKDLFWNDFDRRKHLMNVHSYPNWFRFISRQYNCPNERTNNKTNQKKNSNIGKSDHLSKSMKTIKWWYNKRMNYYKEKKNSSFNDDSMEMIDENNELQPIGQSQGQEQQNIFMQNKIQKLQEKKEKKKKINANIPCRFYNSKGGCWRGNKCMFLHSKKANDSLCNTNNHDINGEKDLNCNSTNDNDNYHSSQKMDMDICQEIDILSNQIQTKAKISVPDNVSFGRRKKRY